MTEKNPLRLEEVTHPPKQVWETENLQEIKNKRCFPEKLRCFSSNTFIPVDGEEWVPNSLRENPYLGPVYLQRAAFEQLPEFWITKKNASQ